MKKKTPRNIIPQRKFIFCTRGHKNFEEYGLCFCGAKVNREKI